jgi:pilus assembly protein CpaF
MTSPVHSATVELVRTRLAESARDPTPIDVATILHGEGRLLGDAAVLAVVDALRHDTLGAGLLEPLLDLPDVTDVLVNGPQAVYVDVGAGLELTDVTFPDDAAVRRLAQRLASSAGRRLDDAYPFVDVRLADGTRFHAVLAPLAKPGTCLSLRVPPRRALSFDELVRRGSMSRQAANLLADLVAAEVGFLVSGGTGSGKTTLLASMLSRVRPDQRIVIVEDSHELRPDHPHVVSVEARQSNVEGVGEIDVRALVRQALRMRPDRLVVGEVRGPEVVDLLAALNTGHGGGCGTLHANSAADVPARLEALGAAAGLPRDALHAQLGAALAAVVHLERGPDHRRRLAEIAVLDRGPDGLVTVRTAAESGLDGVLRLGPGERRLEQLLCRRRC